MLVSDPTFLKSYLQDLEHSTRLWYSVKSCHYNRSSPNLTRCICKSGFPLLSCIQRNYQDQFPQIFLLTFDSRRNRFSHFDVFCELEGELRVWPTTRLIERNFKVQRYFATKKTVDHATFFIFASAIYLPGLCILLKAPQQLIKKSLLMKCNWC